MQDHSRSIPAHILGDETVHALILETRAENGGVRTRIRLDDGTEMWVSAVEPPTAGVYYLPLSLETGGKAPAIGEARTEGHTIPVVKEEMHVSKRRVETGRVRVSTQVHERDEVVDIPLRREEVQVERVPVNEIVDEPIPVRTEGDEMIWPLFEEVLVVQKRLLLREELRIRVREYEEHRPQTVRLRTEEPRIERTEPGTATGNGKDGGSDAAG